MVLGPIKFVTIQRHVEEMKRDETVVQLIGRPIGPLIHDEAALIAGQHAVNSQFL